MRLPKVSGEPPGAGDAAFYTLRHTKTPSPPAHTVSGEAAMLQLMVFLLLDIFPFSSPG